MNITGKVIKKLEKQTGESSRGQWQKQDVVIETAGEYPKTISISCWGERVNELEKVDIGANLTAHISIESREYNERWYTDVRAWKLDFEEYQKVEQEEVPTENSDGLPF